jgi:diguanylate cyclase (GGDEF)-like protein
MAETPQHDGQLTLTAPDGADLAPWPSAPEIGEERYALGSAFSKRLDDVADIQLALGGVRVSTRDVSMTASRAFSGWLMTGKADLPRIGEFTRQGAAGVAQDQMLLRETTKLTLAWRDAAVAVLREEATRLSVRQDVLEDAITAARRSCDAFSVQFAAQYDQERAELQAELAESRAQLEHKATHDPLTGLENRASFFDRLEETVMPALDRSEVVAVLFVDLDGFKLVNDRFGHSVGDTVLKAAAERLRSVIRPGDVLSRIGGDEFVILCGIKEMQETQAEQIAIRVAHRVKSAFVDPFTVGATSMCVSASIGIAVDRNVSGNPEDIVAAADAAMYVAKARGGSGCQIAVAP